MIAVLHPDAFVAGVDHSLLMASTARRPLDRRHVARDIREGSAERLPWPDASFDAVAALHSFQFWPDPVSAFAEIGRVLRPGGTLVLLLRAHAGRDSDWLPNPWSRTKHEVEDALTLLKKAGFGVVRERPDAGSSAVIVATA